MEISFPRMERISSFFIWTRFFPSNRISPSVIKPVRSGRSFMILKAMVDFLLHQSHPTSPRVLTSFPDPGQHHFKAYTSSSSVLYRTWRFLILKKFFWPCFTSSHHPFLSLGSIASLKPSPASVRDITDITTANPGNRDRYG